MSVIKLRGLPWSVNKSDIIKFLDGVNIQNGDDSIHLLTTAEGRLSGEAYVEVETEDDIDAALKHDNALMGQRYIEIFRSTPDQMKTSLEVSVNSNNWNDPIVRLRGLPFSCTKDELARFFDGLQIASNGILMVIDFSGRFNGEAFVMFDDMDNAYKALDMHKKMMGHRYIEIFRTSESEMQYYATNSNIIKINEMFKEAAMAVASNSNYNNNGGGGGNYSRQRPTPYTTKPTNRNTGSGGGYRNNYSSNNNSTHDGIPSLFDFNNYQSIKIENDDYCGDGGDDSASEDKTIKMRGLPYSVNVNDIKEFFKPLIPNNVNLLFGNDGRLSGEAEVDFNNHDDALEALKYDKKYIGTRYIELFLQNKSSNNRRSGHNNTDSNGIPSLLDQMSFFSSQQFLNNQNYNNNNNYYGGSGGGGYNNRFNRRQFNRRGGTGGSKNSLF